MQSLPAHLKKYVVEQNYEKYTPIDHAVWRYVLRQLRAFLSVHAHECYLEGLEKTGIDVEQIPRIADISKKLENFGWRALPVSGFIPPAAFMELQSLWILPIASDMRSIDHLLYTPAPDIVHEAAGHAPILIHPEFAEYLRRYATVARKAILSKEDLDLYEAIRDLSDLKENPQSTKEQIKKAEDHLNRVSKSISHISEASELSRMNWWTAEYGLIGSLDNPKIIGAGLLSSVGESKYCLSEKVKRLPLTVDCIKTGYDITEPQPQLFVARSFADLTRVLEEMAKTMAYQVGGVTGLKKAIQAKSVNTAELSTGLEVSGVFQEVLTDANNQVIFFRTTGPTQLAYKNAQLPGHDKNFHSHGYSTPIGKYTASSKSWKIGEKVEINFESGFLVVGTVQTTIEKDGKTLLLKLNEATVTYQGKTFFEPSWGDFDLAFGTHIPSVYGGPADRAAYGDIDDFVAARVPAPKYDSTTLRLHGFYQQVRDLRKSGLQGESLATKVQEIFTSYRKAFSLDWLLALELYEIAVQKLPNHEVVRLLKKDLEEMMSRLPDKKQTIMDGIQLATVK